MTLNLGVPQQLSLLKPKISVFGVGGAGGNALNNMIKSNLEGVEFIAANTDAQALSNSLAANRIQLGTNLTKGLGAGSFPDRGRAAAEENIEEIAGYLEDNNMIFIAAGMGGGTGTGAAPVIAKLAKEKGILSVGVVTKPFHFEGKYRMDAAQIGIEELKKYVDTLIVIPNQNLFRIANEQTTFEQAFKMADDVLHAGVRSVTDLITMPGLVNLDFADIETIMTKSGRAMMGTGEATGENRAINACQEAISNPLLDDVSIKGAKGVLVNMTGGPDMTLFEVDAVVNNIKKEVDSNANIIFGSAFNEDMKGRIRVSIVATGIDSTEEDAAIKIQSQSKNSANDAANKIDNIGKLDNKTFFDPGLPKAPNQVLEEVKVVDFDSYKILDKINNNEGNINGDGNGHFEEKPNLIGPDNIKIEQKIGRHNIFFDEEGMEKLSKLEEKSAQKKSKIKTKKDSGAFGLFSFMNYKSKLEEELEEEKLDIVPPMNIQISDEDFEIDLQDDKMMAKINNRVNKAPELDDFTSEDDILNVPAFFRRKN